MILFKILKKCLGYILFLLLILFTIFIYPKIGIKGEVLQRTSSPDNKIEFVLTKTSGNATTSFGYRVYLFEKNKKKPLLKNLLFCAEKVDNLSIAWIDNSHLKIAYNEANIYDFMNFSYLGEDNQGLPNRIEIILEKTSKVKD